MATESTLGQLFVDLILRDDAFAPDLQKAETAIQTFGTSVDDLTSGIAGKFQAALEAAGLALAGLAAASAVVGSSFEQEITKVAVLAGGGLDELSKSARAMGASTQYSASEAATAMESLAQAGFKTAEIISGTEAALHLAAASGGDLASATKIVATTMSQFGLKAAESTRIADVFTQALNSSQLDMNSLTVAMSYAGTVGKSFGMTLEQTTAAVAMFSNLGLEGAKAGTAFRMAMSQAANVSKEGQERLAKYNLTIKDIDPSLHSFGEILTTVGKAGMSTNDAMKVFGTEVGGNVKALADQAVSANTDVANTFDGITASLENSAGVADTTAKAMTQTVAGAFEQAGGALEETLLTVYDAYKGPLRELLIELGEVINAIAAQFKRSGSAMSEGFGGALDKITRWLDENQTRIAVFVVDFITDLGEVASQLVELIPYLDEIAVVMATIWAANKVIAFAGALSTAFDAVVALQGGLAALGVEVSVMTAGLYAAVVAVGAVVAALGTYIATTNDATLAAERLQAAQDAQKESNDADLKAQIAHFDELLVAQQEAARAQLSSGEELSAARKGELNQIIALDGAQAALLVQQGKLVESHGELRTAASLVEESFDTASTEKIGDAYKALSDKEGDLVDRTENLRTEIGKLQADYDAGNISAETFGAAISAALPNEKGINSLEDAQIRLESLTDSLGGVRKAQQALKNDATLAQGAMIEAAQRTIDSNNRAANSGEELSSEQKAAAKKLASEQKQAQDASDALAKKARESMEDALANEEQKKALTRAREMEDVTEQFDKQSALYHGDYAKAVEIEFEKQQALAQLRAKYAAEDAADKKKADDDAAAAELKREQDVAAAVAQLRARGEKESVRLAAERDALLGTLTERDAKARAEIEAAYGKQITEAQRVELRAQMDGPSKLLAAWHKAGQDLVELIPDSFRIAFARTTRELGDFVSGAVKGLGSLVSGVEGIANKVEGVITGLVTKITGLKFSVSDMISSLADAQSTAAEQGAEFNPADAAVAFIQGLFSHAADIAQLLAQSIGPALQELAKQIPMIIQAIVDAIPEIVDALVAAIPVIINAIADAIPVVVDAIVDAVPLIIDAIVKALPGLIDAIISALPVLFKALVDGIVQIVQAVMAMLPDIIREIMAVLPEMITTLLEAIPKIITAIVNAIPDVLDALIDGIPAVLEAIFEGIPAIVKAVANAIPEIIAAVIDAIPNIIDAVLQSLPTLIDAIFEAIPDIILGFAEALPDLIPAVIEMIPDIIGAIIMNLPAIIFALVKGLVELVIIKLPTIIWAVIKGLVEGIGKVAAGFIKGIVGFFGSFFKTLGNAFKGFINDLGGVLKKAGDWISGLFKKKDKDKGNDPGTPPPPPALTASAFSGMEYVPATMRMTLHKGERVVAADRNAQAGGGTSPAPAGARQEHGTGGWGEGATTSLAIVAEGRLLEAVQVKAHRGGRASQIARATRRAAGVKVGLDRGKFNPWSR